MKLIIIAAMLLAGCASNKSVVCNDAYKKSYLDKCYADCSSVEDEGWCTEQCDLNAEKKFCTVIDI